MKNLLLLLTITSGVVWANQQGAGLVDPDKYIEVVNNTNRVIACQGASLEEKIKIISQDDVANCPRHSTIYQDPPNGALDVPIRYLAYTRPLAAQTMIFFELNNYSSSVTLGYVDGSSKKLETEYDCKKLNGATWKSEVEHQGCSVLDRDISKIRFHKHTPIIPKELMVINNTQHELVCSGHHWVSVNNVIPLTQKVSAHSSVSCPRDSQIFQVVDETKDLPLYVAGMTSLIANSALFVRLDNGYKFHIKGNNIDKDVIDKSSCTTGAGSYIEALQLLGSSMQGCLAVGVVDEIIIR